MKTHGGSYVALFPDGKISKEIAPRMKHKALASTECVIREYDRAKQRMYKRYERTLDGKKRQGKIFLIRTI